MFSERVNILILVFLQGKLTHHGTSNIRVAICTFRSVNVNIADTAPYVVLQEREQILDIHISSCSKAFCPAVDRYLTSNVLTQESG